MKKFIVIILVALLSCSLYAEVSDFLSEMIDTETVTLKHASYLCVVHINPEDGKASYDEALDIAIFQNLLPFSWLYRSVKKSSYDRNITLGQLCTMMAKTFGVKGGALFRASKGSPRYAFRQFQIDGIVPANADSSHFVSGEEMLNMYTRCVRVYGE